MSVLSWIMEFAIFDRNGVRGFLLMVTKRYTSRQKSPKNDLKQLIGNFTKLNFKPFKNFLIFLAFLIEVKVFHVFI